MEHIGIHQGSNASTERESENTENQIEASISNENISQNEPLVEEIEILIGRVEPPPLSFECRIRRTPDRLRQVKEQAYTPTTISIGPIHSPIHSLNVKFQISERYKVKYFKTFISRTNIPLGMLVSTISKMEGRIRSCYEEDTVFLMGRDEFVRLILFDAVFILELFYRYFCNSWEMDDLTGQLWFIKSDLVLLENQLPFFVLQELYGLAHNCPSYHHLGPLIELASMFFDYYYYQDEFAEDMDITHFTELMRASQLRIRPPREVAEIMALKGMPEMMIVPLLCSATQLYDAGVKFKTCTSSKRLLELHFDFEKGVLEMSSLVVDDQTETLVRNVMALEQFGRWNALMPSFTEYFIFLDSLVNTIEDINLLCDRGMLVDRRGDNKAVLSLVRNLITNISWSCMSPDLKKICIGLNKFYQKPVNRWKATLSVTTLKNQYFNNPWRGSATVAACLLLLLTLIQTIMSILQVDRA